MNLALGIDTSNYTTSLALYDAQAHEICQVKRLLPVKEGEKGLRQSDAVSSCAAASGINGQALEAWLRKSA